MTPKKTTKKPASETATTTKELKAELYSLKMKNAMRELKETHKIKKARKELARHLTKLSNAS